MMQTFFVIFCVFYFLIKLTDETEEKYFESSYENPFDPFERNAVKIEKFKWPNGKILYRFNEKYCEPLKSLF